MDTEILTAIEETVDDYVTNNRLFTAYDVTLAVRAKLGRGKNVRHAEAKEEVHRLMLARVASGLGYLRDLINVGSPAMPFLYYPLGEDPTSYVGGQQATGRFAAIGNLPPPPALPASDDSRHQDRRGRILVPNTLVRDIGLSHGQVAYVSVDNGRLIVHGKEPANYSASYQVDKDDNVRLSNSVVESAKLSHKTYNFLVDNNSIVITGN